MQDPTQADERGGSPDPDPVLGPGLGPVFGIGKQGAYRVPRATTPTDLRLDGNEGCAPDLDLASVLGAAGPDLLRHYPSAVALERAIAERLRVPSEQVIVCAGADDATLRLCTALLGPGREIVLPVPTFEMIARYAALRGCTIREVPWPAGPYPVDGVIDALTPQTALVTVVTPNNPTGAVASAADLAALSQAAPQAVLLVDLAYSEFADEDLTQAALALPNAVVLRTLSKAHGLAGLRVGYAVGPSEVIGWLRQAGNPFPVSGASLALAAAALRLPESRLNAIVKEVALERTAIQACLARLGGRPAPSQANFVLARFRDALRVRDGLAGMGISVRAFPGRAHLEDALRITCPARAEDLARLLRALEVVLAPEALLFDADVLGDTSCLVDLKARLPLGVVTGRSQADVEGFLGDRELGAFFDVVVAPETAARELDPAALTRAMERLGVERAWYVGDTVGHIAAARAAGLLPVGVVGTGAGQPRAPRVDLLEGAGAAHVIEGIEALLGLLS